MHKHTAAHTPRYYHLTLTVTLPLTSPRLALAFCFYLLLRRFANEMFYRFKVVQQTCLPSDRAESVTVKTEELKYCFVWFTPTSPHSVQSKQGHAVTPKDTEMLTEEVHIGTAASLLHVMFYGGQVEYLCEGHLSFTPEAA